MNNQQLEDDMRADYRAGNFLPENYISKEPDPIVNKYLKEAQLRDEQVSELEQKIILLRANLNL